MSLHLSFFGVLENLSCIDKPVMADCLGRNTQPFLQRRWITHEGYLTHVMAPFFDSEEEVEVEIDEDAGCYRYISLQSRRIVRQPLAEIAVYAIQIETWLDDLATLIGIEERRRSGNSCRTPEHLWYLGDLRLIGKNEFAPIFVGRAWAHTPHEKIHAVLADPIWPRGGAVVGAKRRDIALPRDHAMRGLDEFVRVEDGQEMFDVDAFDRVLCGYVAAIDEPEPVQFFKGTRLKLPHFTESRVLSGERVKIIKLMWGTEGYLAPAMSWVDANRIAATGYQSFDDAFGGKAEREDIIKKLPGRGQYRLRRNP